METVIFSEKLLTDIQTHVLREYPQECCGVLLGINNEKENLLYEAVQTENQSVLMKNRYFRISPKDFFAIEQGALQRNLQVIGLYHSHPEGPAVLSDDDVRYMIPALSYPVISIRRMCSGEKQLQIKSYRINSQYELREEKIVCR